MRPVVDHIQITVKNLKSAESFYDKLMPILGFDINRKSKGSVALHEFDVIEYVHDDLTLGINSPRERFRNDAVNRRKPGSLHHLAFKARSMQEVDSAYEELLKIGVNIVESPRFFPQHGESYYAVFFKDHDGIKYEIVFEDRK